MGIGSTTAETLRDTILAEATRLFAEHGYAATSMRRIAQASGCTKAALYYHFQNKEAVFVEAIRTQTDALDASLERDEREDDPVQLRMVRGLQHFFAFVTGESTGMRLLMRAELRPESGQPPVDFSSLRVRQEESIRDLLREGMQRGEVRADVDAGDAAQALMGIVDQRMQSWLHGESIDDDLPERLLRLFFRGVGA